MSDESAKYINQHTPRFKVGDYVKHEAYGVGTIKTVIDSPHGVQYFIKFDGFAFWTYDYRLSPEKVEQ